LTSMYVVFLFAALYFGSRIVRKGPNLELPIPYEAIQPTLKIEPAEHKPDSRPAEAQQ